MSGRAWIGVTFIVTVSATILVLLRDVPGIETLTVRLGDHVSRRLDSIDVRFGSRPSLSPGDPVYSVEGEAFALQGRVAGISESAPWVVTLDVDPSVTRRFDPGTEVVAMTPDADLAWVLKTLVPPDLREEILADIRQLWKARRDTVLEQLEAPLMDLLRDLGEILRDALPETLARHEEERREFFSAFSDDIFPDHLEPVLEREFVHRIEERLGPLAGQIGSEVWDNMTFGDMLSLSWIATKDAVGAASRQAVVDRLTELLRKKALPVFKRHAPKAFQETAATVIEGLSEPSVQEALDVAAREIVTHPAFEAFTVAVAKSWIVDNERIRERLLDAISSDELRGPLDNLWDAAEPLFEQALEEILTRPDREGMDHQLVRVLRRVVLRKDEHYVVLRDGAETGSLSDQAVLTGVIGEDR